MPDVIRYLEKFNRKERYWLLRNALGDKDKNPFTLSDEFRKELKCELGLKISIPKRAFVAMDYHFDWLTMALLLGKRPYMENGLISRSEVTNSINEEVAKKINKNTEDIDLLVAFEDDNNGKTHLILIEAKADSSWDNKQLNSKAERLRIFDKAEIREYCKPHFVLMSPKQSSRLDVEWPDWMEISKDKNPHWLQLKKDPLLKIERDREDYTRLYVY